MCMCMCMCICVCVCVCMCIKRRYISRYSWFMLILSFNFRRFLYPAGLCDAFRKVKAKAIERGSLRGTWILPGGACPRHRRFEVRLANASESVRGTTVEAAPFVAVLTAAMAAIQRLMSKAALSSSESRSAAPEIQQYKISAGFLLDLMDPSETLRYAIWKPQGTQQGGLWEFFSTSTFQADGLF